MTDKYTWDGVNPPVPEPDLFKWGEYMQTAHRHAAKTVRTNGISISTVFLGLDHAFGTGPPVLWETMVFGGPLNQCVQERYTSYENAQNGHHEIHHAIKSRYLRRGVSYRRAKQWLQSFGWHDVKKARKWYGSNRK